MALQEELASQGNWLFRNRSLLPLAILFVGIAAHLFTLHTSGILFSTVFPYWHGYEIFCLIISMAGTFIHIYTVGHTPVHTSGRNTAGQVADSLNTTGIYSIVRHPLYLGNFLMWLAFRCLHATAVSSLHLYWLIGSITNVLCMPKKTFCAASLALIIFVGQNGHRHSFPTLSCSSHLTCRFPGKK